MFISKEDDELARRTEELANKRYCCGICLDDECAIEDMITLSCQPVGHRFGYFLLGCSVVSVSFVICMLTLLLMPLAGLHFCVDLDFVTPSL